MKKIEKKEDKRALTSAQNGAKGGRPSYGYEPISVLIKKEEIVSALEKGDIAEAIEKGVRRALPKCDVYVQSKERLEKAGVHYDFHSGTSNLLLLNNHPVKFEWQLRYFIGEFVALTKGKKDFNFELRVPLIAMKKD